MSPKEPSPRALAKLPPTTRGKKGAKAKDRKGKGVQEEIDMDALRDSMSFNSRDLLPDFGQYTREVFRWSVPVSLKKELRITPFPVMVARMVSDAYYLGVEAFEMLRRAENYDTVMRGEIPSTWRRQTREAKDKLLAELDSLEKEKADLEKENVASASQITKLTEQIDKLEIDVKEKDARVKELEDAAEAHDAEVKNLRDQLVAATFENSQIESHLISEFLGSRSFTVAALTAAGPPCQLALYTTVLALGKHWPLEPEEFGIKEVDDSSCLNLAGCVWNRDKDELIAPDNSVLTPPEVGPSAAQLAAVTPRHPWPVAKWPIGESAWTGHTPPESDEEEENDEEEKGDRVDGDEDE